MDYTDDEIDGFALSGLPLTSMADWVLAQRQELVDKALYDPFGHNSQSDDQPPYIPPPASDPYSPTIRTPVIASPLEFFDIGQIPERQWLYGVHLIRGYSSATVAAPGTGKSTLSMIEAVSIAIGRNLLTDHVHEQANVWLYNLEDPMEELKRRLAAICIKFKVPMQDLIGKFFINSGRDRDLCVLARGRGVDYVTPDRDGMIAAVKANNIGAVFIDPFISSYEGDENNNKDVDRAVKTFNAIADATGCAIDLIHHTGKQTNEAGSQNAGRGGSSLVGAIRSMRTLVSMSEDEAKEYRINDQDRYEHIRIDGAKSNMAKVRGVNSWVKIEPINLMNGPEGTRGDDVAVLSVWKPPNLFDGIRRDQSVACLKQIEFGRPEGLKYHKSNRGRAAEAWVGNIVIEMLPDTDADRAKSILNVWFGNGVLFEEAYQDKSRHEVMGVAVNLDKLREIESG